MMRKSNIELLRLITMFMVLVLHANYLSIGTPEVCFTSAEFYIRHFIEVVTFIAVDVFILISGFFSIRPNLKSISNFLFCCFFYSVGIRAVYSLTCFFTGVEASFSFVSSFFFLSNSVWFVVDYLMLMVFAPILNSFIDSNSSKKCVFVVLLILLFSFYFGFYRLSLIEYISGFSFVSFILLYLIGRILHQNKEWLDSHVKSITVGGGYLLGTFLLYAIVIIAAYKGHSSYLTHLGNCRVFSYNNPLLILSAVCFFWLFTKKEFYSNRINKFSKSTIAIMLIHTNPVAIVFYNKYFDYLYNHFSFGIYLILMVVSCFLVLVASILIDQIRLFIYNRFISPIVLKIGDKTKCLYETF